MYSKFTLFVLATLIIVTLNAQVPVINSFSPISGSIGSTVVINGSNFSNVTSNNIVYFGAVKANVISASSSQLSVIVPSGATHKPITVTTNGLTAYSSASFNMKFACAGASSAFNSSSFSSSHNLFNSQPFTVTLAVADLDNDGKIDIMSQLQNSTYLSVYRNNSTPATISFNTPLNIAIAGLCYGIATGDLDGDGKLDVVQVSYSSSDPNSVTSVLRNTSTTGNISFAPRLELNSGNSYSVSINDIDNDGKPDIIMTNFTSNSVTIYRNLSSIGNLSFSTGVDYYIGSQPISIAVTDLDGDGKQDIIAVNQNADVVSYIQNTSTVGNISFTSNYTLNTGSSPRFVRAEDIDGDGKKDLIISNSGSSSITIIKNASTTNHISFATSYNYSVGNTPVELFVDDLNGDGKSDILVACPGNNEIAIIKNNSTTGNFSMANSSYYPINSTYSIVTGDVNGDGLPDIITSTTGSSSNATVAILANQLCGGLPVEIQSFTAKIIDNLPTLLWQTTTEVSTSYFNIQRSSNSIDFITIGTVNAKGSSEYNFTDNEIGSNRGTYYYRLEIIDKDGSKSYSEIRTILFAGNVSQFTFFPNPAKDFVVISGNNIKQVNLMDFTGKVLIEKHAENINSFKMQISTLPAGIYLLQAIYIDGNAKTSKLIVR